ncbi:hypothetical protein B0533_07260 [Sedimentibacter sp. SX930]|nr:hypothetical protein B0533_07260 [Sedimentibacter sp. SX930]
MNISNFQKYINDTILGRGYDYYVGGQVDEEYVRKGDTYIFRVEGREAYEVSVELDDSGEIIHAECDCPYDLGPICKHKAAVFFQLAEIINNGDVKWDARQSPTELPGIKEVLNKLPKEELIRIIMEIVPKNKTLEESLILRYSDGNNEQELKQVTKLIRRIVNKYAGRGGFIAYGEISDYVDEMVGILEKARNTADSLLALEIIILVLHEAMEAFQYTDDSDGEIGGLASDCIEVMEELVLVEKISDSSSNQKLFNRLLEDSDDHAYDDWQEYTIDILRLCAEVADTEALRVLLRARVMAYLDKSDTDGFSTYYAAPLLQILHRLIVVYGTDAEALQFEEENSAHASFREMLIERAKKENNFEKVISLAIDGEKQDDYYAGRKPKWKEIRYDAYKKLSLKDEQARLAKEMLFDGHFEYYQELKDLNTGDEKEFYDELKAKLKKDTRWQAKSMYINLIEQEEDTDEVMAYVRENPQYIARYAELLKDHYADEVDVLYSNHIRSAAHSSSKRSAYQDVCSLIRRYKNIAGKANAAELVNELLVLYKKKRAFVDELSKLNF